MWSNCRCESSFFFSLLPLLFLVLAFCSREASCYAARCFSRRSLSLLTGSPANISLRSRRLTAHGAISLTHKWIFYLRQQLLHALRLCLASFGARPSAPSILPAFIRR